MAHNTPSDDPAPQRDPELALKHIADISQNARTTWFALLALLAFVGVTMMAHKDSDFFAAGVSTQLPLIGIDVPTISFFIAAPLLVAAVYTYQHIFLISLWDELSEVDAKIGVDTLFDRVPPTLIAQTAVIYRAEQRGDGCADTRAFSGAMKLTCFLLVWAMAPLLLAYVFWRSTAYHDPLLSIWIGLCLFVASAFGYEGWRVATGRLSGHERDEVHAPWTRPMQRQAAYIGVAILFVGWLFTSGLEPLLRWTAPGRAELRAWWLSPVDPADRYASWQSAHPDFDWFASFVRGPLTRADLSRAALTERPINWLTYQYWLEDFEKRFRDRESITSAEELQANYKDAFEKEAADRYRGFIASLKSSDLSYHDLRNANVARAFLPGADLRRARLQGSNFLFAEMQGANLSAAKLQGASLAGAELQGANLFHAQLQGALLDRADLQRSYLRQAELLGTSLERARLQGADLREANLSDANLMGALMQDADLSFAWLQRAVLLGASLHGAKLVATKLQGADLFFGQVHGADLRGAEMQEVDLSGAQMQVADLRGAEIVAKNLTGVQPEEATGLPSIQRTPANLRGAALHSALVVGDGEELSQENLHLATGNEKTRLKDGLMIVSCIQGPLDALPDEFQEALGHKSASDRQSFLALVLCDPDADDPAKRAPTPIDGTWVEDEDGNWRDTKTGLRYVKQENGEWVDVPPEAGE
ncbi:MAG: pentapeptide repeat-containing protein [Pseudomonadota bacterium]